MRNLSIELSFSAWKDEEDKKRLKKFFLEQLVSWDQPTMNSTQPGSLKSHRGSPVCSLNIVLSKTKKDIVYTWFTLLCLFVCLFFAADAHAVFLTPWLPLSLQMAHEYAYHTHTHTHARARTHTRTWHVHTHTYTHIHTTAYLNYCYVTCTTLGKEKRNKNSHLDCAWNQSTVLITQWCRVIMTSIHDWQGGVASRISEPPRNQSYLIIGTVFWF